MYNDGEYGTIEDFVSPRVPFSESISFISHIKKRRKEYGVCGASPINKQVYAENVMKNLLHGATHIYIYRLFNERVGYRQTDSLPSPFPIFSHNIFYFF